MMTTRKKSSKKLKSFKVGIIDDTEFVHYINKLLNEAFDMGAKSER